MYLKKPVEKIAAFDWGTVAKAVGGGLTPLAAGMALSLPSKGEDKTRTEHGEFVKKLLKQTDSHKTTKHKFLGYPTTYVELPFNTEKPHVIHSHKSVDEPSLLHEIGHTKVHEKVPLLTGLAGASNLASTPSSIITGAMSAASTKPSFTPGLVNLAINSPVLLHELLASIYATKKMTEQHGLKEGLKGGAKLIAPFGSYAAVAGTPLAITLVRKLINK